MTVVSGADRQPGVAGGGLDEYLFKGRLIENFPVGQAIESHSAGQANGLLLGLCVQPAEHSEQDLFEARL